MNNKVSSEQHLFVKGRSGPIEALISIPSQPFHRIAVICHPHPLYGGTLHNKVVYTLAKTLQEENIATVRFNFRGVGKSAGYYGAGEGEVYDLRAIFQWLQKEYPSCSLWLAGFSFGAYIALAAASSYPLEQLILVAPPVEHFPVMDLPLPQCPWIVVQGESDEIVPPQMVFDWVKTLSPAPTLIRMPNTTHFFHGHLGELQMKLLEVLKKRL